MRRIYKVTVCGLTLVTSARSKADAYRAFKVMAAVEGMNSSWINRNLIERS